MSIGKEILHDIKESMWALLFPVLLVITIRLGIFTPSEAGAFAVVYAIWVGFFIHKELDFRKLKQAIQDTVEDNAIIMLIVSMAAILGYVLAYGRVPQSLAQLILGISTVPGVVLGIIILFLFLVGTVMEGEHVHRVFSFGSTRKCVPERFLAIPSNHSYGSDPAGDLSPAMLVSAESLDAPVDISGTV